VFPPKVGGQVPPAASASPAPSKASPAVAPRERALPPGSGIYTIQIAAVTDPARARTIVAELTGAGFAAYLVEPSRGDGPYRIRVGRFATRASARQMAVRLQSHVGSKPWVTTTR
jgi:cell division septation protein DedD